MSIRRSARIAGLLVIGMTLRNSKSVMAQSVVDSSAIDTPRTVVFDVNTFVIHVDTIRWISPRPNAKKDTMVFVLVADSARQIYPVRREVSARFVKMIRFTLHLAEVDDYFTIQNDILESKKREN